MNFSAAGKKGVDKPGGPGYTVIAIWGSSSRTFCAFPVNIMARLRRPGPDFENQTQEWTFVLFLGLFLYRFCTSYVSKKGRAL